MAILVNGKKVAGIGQPGKSAYQTAVEGGYTGSESEFNQILANAATTDYVDSNFVSQESGKGLSTNDFTTEEKNKLAGIAAGANNYSLPTASASTLGGIRVGEGLSISDGILNVNGGGLTVIASARDQSLAYGLNVTLPSAASYLLYQVWRKDGSRRQTPTDFAMFLPGDTVVAYSAGQYLTTKQFTGTQFFYRAPEVNPDEYYISYVALG